MSFSDVTQGLRYGDSSALIQSQRDGAYCLLDLERTLVSVLGGHGTRTYELGDAAEYAETHPEGHCVDSATIASGPLVMDERVVHVAKIADDRRHLRVVAVAVHSMIPGRSLQHSVGGVEPGLGGDPVRIQDSRL